MSNFINNLAYEASAGSGKTFMLVVRYLSLLFQGAEPSKILALTFTNKAAAEMNERIIATLEDLQNRGELELIIEVTGLSRQELLAQKQKLLTRFLSANTKIMTIDKFFTQILRKFSLYSALMPDFSTQNAQHEVKLLSRFLKEVSTSGKKETLISLSLESKKRLESIFTLLEELYSKKYEVLKLRFTKQNISSYEEEALLYAKELAGIVHGCELASKIAKGSMVFEDFDTLCSKSWITKETLDYSTYKKCFIPQMDQLLTKVQEAILKQYRAREENFFYALHSLVAIYDRSKKALASSESELSFNDVTLLVYYLLKERIDSEFLYFRLDAQIQHILLDEFQDTSIIQYEILNPLITEILSGMGAKEGGSFFFVGDVKQSIYRFRGGVSALFAQVAQEHQTKVEPLVTNYRSQKEVIEFVNEVFAQKITHYLPQHTRTQANGGYVEVITNEALLEECVLQVKRLLELGAKSDSIAILCATNPDGDAIKNALELQNIEVVTETTTRLISQQSVRAVLEYLKYQYFKEEIYRYNFFCLINRDLEKINYKDLTKISLLDLVTKVIEEYELFSNEFHLIRFLDTLRSYNDIESLLFEYERLDTSAASSDISGVRVLTIHKSKGLEYEHVIVLDRLKKAPANRSTIIYEYEGTQLNNIYLRIKGRDALDKQYAQALLKEKQLAKEDTLNALYVAFTRAKRDLFVIRKEKDSSFELLELRDEKRGKLLALEHSKTVQKQEQKLHYKQLYYGTQSDLLVLAREQEESFENIHFGLGLHYMLEMMHSFVPEALKDARAMLLNKYGATLKEDQIDAIEKRVKLLLSDQEFLELTAGECMREKALKYKNNLRYIDLLVKVQKQDPQSLFGQTLYRVIDYKSSKKHHQEYIKQIESYKKAIHTITSDEVEGYLCYLLEDRVEIIEV